MSEVNWDENAKEAVEKFYEYLDEQGMHYANSSACIADFFEWITSKQTKTVEDAVERKYEKWTHLTPIGDPCFIKLNEPDCEGLILIEIRNDGYELVKPEQLKPIKPTLSKSEAWDLCQDYDGSKSMKKYMYDLHDEYDII